MTTLREAAQQALEALENAEDQLAKPYSTDASKAITALRTALAQQAEPGPGKVVAWGVFALADGEWQLQHPVFVGDECGKENAEFERASYSGPQPLEVRPLGVVTATAQQAEPVEPVAGVVLNEEGRAALVEHGSEEWHCAARNARRLYTAPPQQAEPVEPVAWMHNILEDNIIRHRPADLKRSPQNWTPLCNCAQPRQSDPQIEDRLARHGIPKP